MLVADKLGLFDDGSDVVIRKHSESHWEICEIDYYNETCQYISHGETGPLAICLAILEVSKK